MCFFSLLFFFAFPNACVFFDTVYRENRGDKQYHRLYLGLKKKVKICMAAQKKKSIDTISPKWVIR